MFKNNEMKTCFPWKSLSRWSRFLSTLATRTTSLRRSRSQGRSLSPLSRLLRTRREPSTRLPHHLQQLCPPERGMTNHRLLLSSVPYYNVIFIPGKWHQRPALRKKKAAFFKRFNHQSSNSQPKLEVNLVAMVCLCSPEATCPSSLHLGGCLSPKPTSSSWPSSATPALYSQDRWFAFSIKFVEFAFMQVDCDNLITPDLPVRKISHDLPYQVNSTKFFLWHSGSPVAGLLGGGCQAGFLQEKHGV